MTSLWLVVTCFVFSTGVFNAEAKYQLVGTQRQRSAAELRAIQKDVRIDDPDDPLLFQIAVGTPISCSSFHEEARPKRELAQKERKLVTFSAQTFKVAIDLSTDYMWLLNKNYTGRQTNQSFYDPSISSTSRSMGYYLWDAGDNFGTYGHVYSDLYQIPKMTNQSFSVVEKIYQGKDEVSVNVPDGVVGFAWNASRKPSDPTPPILTFFESLPSTTPKTVLISLKRDASSLPSSYTSVITFGEDDENHCNTFYETAPLDFGSSVFPERASFTIDLFKIKDYSDTRSYLATLDISQYAVIMPSDAYSNVYDMLQPTYDYELSIWVVDCAKSQSSDYQLKFEIKKAEISVYARNYIYDIGYGDGQCAAAFDLSDSNTWSFGNPFFLTNCVKFDVEKQEVGFSVNKFR
ncbi:hypothetical protein M3Y96_00435400 [Aphelenchoides besseyi]|nr:hypothetical protein M3Y96_00435400 [Aphelenchoides besseyi]